MSGSSKISQTYSFLMSSIQKRKDWKSKKVCAITLKLKGTVNVISNDPPFVQGCNVRKVYCSLVYSAYILKPVLSGRNL